MIRSFTLALLCIAVGLSACSDAPYKPLKTQWDTYYATIDAARTHVIVVPPEGTTVPMAKLIAHYVVKSLMENNVTAEIGDGTPSKGRHFVLTGIAEENFTDPRLRYRRVLRWLLSDAGGRVISSYAQGIEGSDKEWDFGSARLLEAIGINTAGPVAQMVQVEAKATTLIDPLRQGLLIGEVTGISMADGKLLAASVKDALRRSDVLVTGDVRQAAFRLGGHVQMVPAKGGALDVRVTWTVSALNGEELGSAVQENQIMASQIQSGWGNLAPYIGKAAALGVEHVFGTRPGPAPGAENRAIGEPPAINMPGEPGRAPPPPQ